jgi:hypothetical protein
MPRNVRRCIVHRRTVAYFACQVRFGRMPNVPKYDSHSSFARHRWFACWESDNYSSDDRLEEREVMPGSVALHSAGVE